ncbi:propanediol/glycerol family dehydratase large subunit, partial [Salmonella enterica]
AVARYAPFNAIALLVGSQVGRPGVLTQCSLEEAAWRGFDEQETTVAVARYAPFNAIALLVGSQVGRPGVLTQCSLEEA